MNTIFSLQEAMASIDLSAANERLIAVLADKICEKLSGNVPEGWQVYTWGHAGDIYFTPKAAVTKEEFRNMSKIIELAVGRKRDDAKANLSGDIVIVKHLWTVPATEEKYGPTLYITLSSRIPEGCQVTFRDEMVSVAVVDEACLGLKAKEYDEEAVVENIPVPLA